MTITPIMNLPLITRKDALRARQRARRIASLLQFEPHEHACIVAGTFVIACQALTLLGNAKIYFQIDNNQLQIYAEAAGTSVGCQVDRASRAVAIEQLYRLVKPLPQKENVTEDRDLVWLVEKIEETAPAPLFDELVKQNEEVLTLLHELRSYRAKAADIPQKPASPHAA